VLDIGGKERKYMSNTINYTDAPADIEQSLGGATIVSDFLPSPAELVSRVEKEKITISVDKHSLELYKKYAKKHNTKYQPMINGVLSSYADKFLNIK
jgi:predicted DNA binding CopG/RHH family protein